MDAQSFTTSFTVDKSPKEIFEAITNVRGWWSGEIEGPTDELGAEFTYRYENLHRSRQKITELVPGKKVVWRVLDGEINFVRDKTEWNGTEIAFEISEKEGKSELRFTHIGLAPRIQCYGECVGAWGFYINDSLRNLILSGKPRSS
jgi:hypothetical protein